MFTRILTPLDGSELSEMILPYVKTLALGLGAQVVLLRVYQDLKYEITSDEDADDNSIMDALDPLAQHMQRQAVRYMEPVAEGLRELGISTAIEVRSGSPAEHIVAEAERVENTLVAMSTNGRTGIGRWVMGSVTDRVLHTTMTPLLVVHPEQGSPSVESTAAIRTLIVPLDGSDLAETVLPVAGAMAEGLNADVLLTITVTAASGSDEASAVGRQMEEAKEYLARQASALHSAGLARVHTTVSQGRPQDEIERTARNTPDSMIIACTHGRSGVGRTVLGSVTDRLARHSGEPALIIRART